MERLFEIVLNGEEKDILTMLLKNELEFYAEKEEIYEEDKEYIEMLKKILEKVWN